MAEKVAQNPSLLAGILGLGLHFLHLNPATFGSGEKSVT